MITLIESEDYFFALRKTLPTFASTKNLLFMKTQSVILALFMGIFLFAACEKSMNNRQATAEAVEIEGE